MKTEGTILLEGLIEGRISTDPEGTEKLRAWVKFATKAGLVFNLDLHGGSFNLLPSNTPIEAKTLGPDRIEVISALLRELMKCFLPPERSKVFSTLRSIEYGRNREIQVLYAFTPTGDVKFQDREVEAKTVAPQEPISTREKVRMAGSALLVVAAVVGISTFFVPYKDIWRNLTAQAASFDAKKIEVDATAFAEYFTIADRKISQDGKALILLLKRSPVYPTSLADVERATTRPTSRPAQSRLALDAAARGYIHVETFSDNDRFLGSAEVRVRDLANNESAPIAIPLSRDPRTVKVVLTY